MALGKEQIQAMRKFALDSSYPDKKIQLDLIDLNVPCTLVTLVMSKWHDNN